MAVQQNQQRNNFPKLPTILVLAALSAIFLWSRQMARARPVLHPAQMAKSKRPVGPSANEALRTLAKLPLAFEPAGARAEHSTEFLARANSFEVMLDPRWATFVTASKTGASPSPPRAWGACSAEPAVGDAAESLFDHKDDLGERRQAESG